MGRLYYYSNNPSYDSLGQSDKDYIDKVIKESRDDPRVRRTEIATDIGIGGVAGALTMGALNALTARKGQRLRSALKGAGIGGLIGASVGGVHGSLYPYKYSDKDMAHLREHGAKTLIDERNKRSLNSK